LGFSTASGARGIAIVEKDTESESVPDRSSRAPGEVPSQIAS